MFIVRVILVKLWIALLFINRCSVNYFFYRLGISIHDAAKTGNLDRIKELISVVPEMKNKTDERGMNPLHLAAANGRLDCVKWLAVSGVDLAEETPTGYTAMHLAAMNGHVNCMMVGWKRNSNYNEKKTPNKRIKKKTILP